MTKTVEQLAEEIYKEMLADGEEITKTEALEMAEMELKAKGIKNYAHSIEADKKPKAKHEIKLDDTKVHLVKMLATLLGGMSATDNVDDVKISNPQKEITFCIGSDEYSVTLTKHRPKK